MKDTRVFIYALVISSIFFISSVICFALPPEEKSKSRGVSEIVNDAARLKLLMFDLHHNLVKLDWEDRKIFGIGQETIRKKALKIAVKYKMDTKRLGNVLSYDVREVGGTASGQDNGSYISVTIPDKWSYVWKFKKNGQLPVVMFKSGGIILYFNSYTLVFEDKTECKVNNKEYIYDKSSKSWVPK